MSRPFLSIIMPSFNQAQFIESAIDSVLSQTYDDLELVVQDGGSTDGTCEKLNRIQLRDSRVKWESKGDSGPAEALNNALARTSGEVIGWLNSDDLYIPTTLERIVEAFEENPSWMMCYGRGQHINADGEPIADYPTREPEHGIEGFKSGCFICQPSAFFRRTLLDSLGDLDANLRTAFDYEYWVRAFKVFDGQIGFLDSLLAQSRLHDECITNTMRDTVALEGMLIGQRHLGGAQSHWAATYLDELYASHSADSVQFSSMASNFLDKAREFMKPHEIEQIQWSISQILRRNLIQLT